METLRAVDTPADAALPRCTPEGGKAYGVVPRRDFCHCLHHYHARQVTAVERIESRQSKMPPSDGAKHLRSLVSDRIT